MTSNALVSGAVFRKTSIASAACSFLPGMKLPEKPVTLPLRALQVWILIPTDDELVTLEQQQAVMELKEALFGRSPFIKKPSFGFEGDKYIVKVPIEAPAANYPDLLSWFFYTVNPVIEAQALLVEGFCGRKPYWRAMIGADFKAAGGSFGPDGYLNDPEAADVDPADDAFEEEKEAERARPGPTTINVTKATKASNVVAAKVTPTDVAAARTGGKK